MRNRRGTQPPRRGSVELADQELVRHETGKTATNRACRPGIRECSVYFVVEIISGRSPASRMDESAGPPDRNRDAELSLIESRTF
jgi:hypothetical protein